ncbi:carboxylating nicotinate-nucleotide diphosphorylase [bacterium]|nr:carboxylating nicotinate-nucleotide diphosphorylase [bacterium]
MKPWLNPSFYDLLKIALSEDLQTGDATSESLIPENTRCKAVIIAKEPCIVCGQHVAESIFKAIDRTICFDVLVPDGAKVESGIKISMISGMAHPILAAERVSLNFMQRMSGIATATNRLVNIVRDTDCRVVDTRKTLPGHRILDKYAVRIGGGQNHRMNLGDGILIKDNHIEAVGSITAAIKTTRFKARHNLKIQIEVKSFEESIEAVEAGADALLLDNMTPAEVLTISDKFRNVLLLECSGNISAETILDYANTGIHIVSVGALTHSVIAADLSLLFQ